MKQNTIYYISVFSGNERGLSSVPATIIVKTSAVPSIINDLKRITINTGFFNISTRPARKTLVDGRNAHLIIKPVNWWLSLFLPIFYIEHLQQSETGFIILVRSNSLTV